ncbi:hypothetical protein A0H81_11410 [Grifola frondosa]|uniref:Uncharacterized protein n=1 Tax=Grifola frondosa TaxID=5627 RepID=A0A1C7LV82_GRIFR|nr:hypothetical protein A0H81_11410 [Grifola frondosa]
MDALRNTNRLLCSQVYVAALSWRFSATVSSAGGFVQTDCVAWNQLVMTRLRHEELESELVGYKLLYAEAVHQSRQDVVPRPTQYQPC